MISFSGIDCSGKSTQIEIVQKLLKDRNIKNRVIWSRGGYTPWVEKIKNLIRRDKGFSDEQKDEYRQQINNSSPKAKLLLWASIWDLVRYYGLVFRWIEFRGVTIICDRYIWDTYIDFKIKFRQIDFENWICWKILLKCVKKPEYSIVFVIPVAESMLRSDLKNDLHPETHEQRTERIAYYIREIKIKRWSYVIDAMQSIEEVTDEIKAIIGM